MAIVKKCLFLFVQLVLVFPVVSVSQVSRLAELKLDSMFARWNKPGSPGCVVGIVKNGELIYKKGYGYANLDYDVPLTEDSKFYIASDSKQFTAACINLLVANGKLKLSDRVTNYIPELPEYADEITIYQLLHHTSGLRDYLTLMELSGRSVEDYFNINDAIAMLKKQKALNFTPGEKFSYSNSGYTLLAEIVNRVSGTSIRKFADKNIFRPLGMVNTFFNDDYSKVTKNRVISYRSTKDKDFKRYVQHFDALGDGNVLTTLQDLYLWDKLFYSKKEEDKKFIGRMLERGVNNNNDTIDYASGLFVTKYREFDLISHGGVLLGFRTQLLRFPDQQLSVIFLSNSDLFDPFLEPYQVADIFLPPSAEKRELSPRRLTVKKAHIRGFVGDYESPDNPQISVRVTLNNGVLMLKPRWINSPYETYPVGETEFVKLTDPEVSFFFSPLLSGKSEWVIAKLGASSYRLNRVNLVDPSTVRTTEYIGDYFSDELSVSYSIRERDGRLYYKLGKNDEHLLTPTEKDTFTGVGERIVFARSHSGVDGFTFSVERAAGIRFRRHGH